MQSWPRPLLPMPVMKTSPGLMWGEAWLDSRDSVRVEVTAWLRNKNGKAVIGAGVLVEQLPVGTWADPLRKPG